METKNLNRGLRALAGSILVIGLGAVPAMADVLYSDIPSTDVSGGPEVTSYASVANGATSFGSVISPSVTGVAGASTIMMSNYATASQYNATPGGSYNVDMGLALYSVTGSGTGNTPDTVYTSADLTLLDTYTQSFAVSYRPEADPSAVAGGCGGGNSNAYLVSPNTYSCGQLAALTFNTNDLLTAGTSYVWVASILNGSDPAAQSLNWAINNLTDPTSISAASNPQYDTNFVNGVDGTGWASIGQGEAAFSTVAPEPATFGLIGLGLLGIGVSVRKKTRKN